MSLLPVTDFRVLAAAAAQLPVVAAVCGRHGLPAPSLDDFRKVGEIIVFRADAVVVKLASPRLHPQLAAERAALDTARGRLEVATPTVVAAGELEDWHYLLMSRLPGRSLAGVWPQLDGATRRSLAATLGRALAALHALPTPTLPALASPPETLSARLSRLQATVVERQRMRGLPAPWLAELPHYLAPVDALLGDPAVLLHGDATPFNILVELAAERPRLSGLIDFGDACLGPREHDLVAPALYLGAATGAFLTGLGLTGGDLSRELRRRLLSHALLAEHLDLTRLVAARPTSLAALAEELWPSPERNS